MGYVIYVLVVSVLIFLAGRVYPREWIKYDKFPFKLYKFEQNGAVYEKLKIKAWKDKWPNASVLLSKLCRKIPEKRITAIESDKLMVLIQESCIAEITHCVAIVLGYLYLAYRRSRWTVALSVIYCVINIPPIIIQRYNRPRYISAYRMLQRRECRKKIV